MQGMDATTVTTALDGDPPRVKECNSVDTMGCYQN